MRRPESVGTGTSPAAVARCPALGKARKSLAPTSSEAPRNGPKPGMYRMIAACGCSANVVSICASRALSRLSRARMAVASSVMMLALSS